MDQFSFTLQKQGQIEAFQYLLSYLQQNFKNGEQGQIGTAQVNLVPHFLSKFGVNVKRQDDLYQFKYDMLAAKWQEPVTHACRGTIIRFQQTWIIVSLPFDKFFNQVESYCPIAKEEVFNSLVDQLAIVEKADGTMIQCWFDQKQNIWRASTGGTISPLIVQGSLVKFDELFWNTLNLPSLQIVNADPNLTYIFELCCEENRIITKYDQNCTFLLGIRSKINGAFKGKTEQLEFIEQVIQKQGRLKTPMRQDLKSLNIHNLKDTKKFVEQASLEFKTYGEHPEGFIIYNNFEPIAKIKNSRYLQLHAFNQGGDQINTQNKIIESFFMETLDDFYGILSPQSKIFADSLKEKVILQYQQVTKQATYFENKIFKTQKEYAIYVQRNVDKQFQPFFFQEKENILQRQCELLEIYRQWLGKFYNKFDDYWKQEKVTQVQ